MTATVTPELTRHEEDLKLLAEHDDSLTSLRTYADSDGIVVIVTDLDAFYELIGVSL